MDDIETLQRRQRNLVFTTSTPVNENQRSVEEMRSAWEERYGRS